jgi:hypothetical protein
LYFLQFRVEQRMPGRCRRDGRLDQCIDANDSYLPYSQINSAARNGAGNRIPSIEPPT